VALIMLSPKQKRLMCESNGMTRSSLISFGSCRAE
jgi:hypothetical protein